MRVRSPRTRPSVFGLFALLLVLAGALAPPGAAAPAPSALLGAPDGSLYLFHHSARYAADAATIAALGFDELAARPLSQRALERIPEGARLPALRNGSFIGAPDGTRYLLFDGAHRIADDATFVAYGWDGLGGFPAVPVEPVSAALLAALPARAPVAPAGGVAGGNRFDWGYCTWWVAQRRAVPWLGDAQEWYGNARSMGYAVGDAPAPGAILVRRSSSWSGYGHVAYVESVAGGRFTVSEMNVRAVGELTTRTYDMDADPPPGLIGFIYWRYGPVPSPAGTETPAHPDPWEPHFPFSPRG